jgi:hypothetical protein
MTQDDAHVAAGFQWEYSKEACGNYLVLTLPESVRLIAYQAQLLKENPHPGLIPFEVQRSDHRLKLYYQLAGRISLLQYVQREDTAPAQIIAVLDRVVAILMESKNLLLYPAGFFLQAEYIFLEPHRAEASLIYVPAKPLESTLLVNANECFRHLLKNVFHYREDLPPEIFTWCDEENFQLNSFRERLKELKFSDWKKEHLGTGVKEKPFQLTEATNGATDVPRSVVTTVLSTAPFGLQLPKIGIFGLFLLPQLLLTTFLFLSFPQVFNFTEEPTSIVGTGLILAAVNVLFLRKLN